MGARAFWTAAALCRFLSDGQAADRKGPAVRGLPSASLSFFGCGFAAMGFALLFLAFASLGHAADETMSARIDSIQKASNGVYISFKVTGAPDFVDVEGSPTLTGIYREEQNVEIASVSPGVMRAFVPISTDDRFLRIRLLPSGTNTLILPIEAQHAFGDAWISGFNLTPLQQVYAAAEFADAAADIINITEIAFRLNETASSMDITLPRLTIKMGVYPKSMLELPPYGLIPTQFTATVYDRQNVRLTAAAGGSPSAFGVRLPFDVPYHYDRNRGQLVLQVEKTEPANYRSFDAATAHNFESGVLYLSHTSPPPASPGMVVTKFLYTAVAEP